MKNIGKSVLFLTTLAMFLSLPALAQEYRPRLGVSVTEFRASPLLLQHLRLAEGEGLLIQDIAQGSAAEREGLSQGDILLAIDAKPMSSRSKLVDYIRALPPHSNVILDVIQKGEHRQISFALDSLPDNIQWKHKAPRYRRAAPPQIMPLAPQFGQSSSASSSQHLMYRSQVQTKNGIELSTVIVTGEPNDPESEVSVELGGNKSQCKMKDLDKMPETVQRAVRDAIASSPSVALSFGGSAAMGFDEMFKRQIMEMRRFEEEFLRRNAIPTPELNSVPDSQYTAPPAKSPIQIITEEDKANLDMSRIY
ncbi:MAG: PDZ domain-containing protein [Bradymonadales bacterium]|jgi:membrane-associated protease RseP (regulator of RpoE activity)